VSGAEPEANGDDAGSLKCRMPPICRFWACKQRRRPSPHDTWRAAAAAMDHAPPRQSPGRRSAAQTP